MKKLYNVDHQPAVVEHGQPAVMPGQSHPFTDDQIEAGIAGAWSEDAPRKREKPAKPDNTEPAQPGKDEK